MTRKPEYYNIQETAYADAKQKDDGVKHDLEWPLCKLTMEHVFKSEHGLPSFH
jgi:hypothetical protein